MKNLENETENLMEGGEVGKSKGRITSAIFAVVLIASLATSGYFAYAYYSLRQNPNSVAQEEVKSLIAQVGRLIDLPTEEPTVATVVDAEALKSQAFFAKAQKGDKVLIYPNAKKAFLYSVTMNKIIEVGPVLLGDQNQQPAAPAPTPNQ
ncbi:MAG: hypothetical protein Q8L47_00175 [bacterium]|nr:hypothetical protein [bacterium]